MASSVYGEDKIRSSPQQSFEPAAICQIGYGCNSKSVRRSLDLSGMETDTGDKMRDAKRSSQSMVS